MRRLWRPKDQRGSVAVEFALLAPLMVIILFGIIEMGLALTRTLAYQNGAREGARYAAVRCSPDATVCTAALIQTRIVNSMPAGYPVSFTSFSAPMNCTPGSIAKVTWQQTVPVDVPFLPDLSWTITPTGAFRCE